MAMPMMTMGWTDPDGPRPSRGLGTGTGPGCGCSGPRFPEEGPALLLETEGALAVRVNSGSMARVGPSPRALGGVRSGCLTRAEVPEGRPVLVTEPSAQCTRVWGRGRGWGMAGGPGTARENRLEQPQMVTQPPSSIRPSRCIVSRQPCPSHGVTALCPQCSCGWHPARLVVANTPNFCVCVCVFECFCV